MTGAFAGERAVVIGYGTSGRAAAMALLREGAEVRVSEARPLELVTRPLNETLGTAPVSSSPDALPSGEEPQVEILAGGHRPEHLEGATLVVLSPGVPQGAPVVEWARRRKLRIWSELELGSRLCRVPFVAVTGTNGKTTTVELLAGMMRAAGLRARACGNVGYPFSRAASEPFDALAVEASSFQLRFHESFHPLVSVLLNVAPDHLDWHGSFRAYADAKARIFALQSEGDVHVGNRDDPEAARISGQAGCRLRWFRSGPPRQGEVGIQADRLLARVEGDVELGEPRYGGRAFALDAAAASCGALSFGLPADAVRRGLAGFVQLPHRGAVVARIGGVRFVDDSKATNPHAALTAIEGLSGVVLIAGGLAKGVDLSPLAAATPALAAVVAIGEAAPAIESLFEGLVPVRRAASIEDAVSIASSLAPPQGTVLLAPACASQDMFRDYGERGDRFAAAARALADGPASRGGRGDRGGGRGSIPSGAAVRDPAPAGTAGENGGLRA